MLLRLFGEVALGLGDRRVTGRAVQRHRLALLALLAANRSSGMSRDKLIAYLWPESDADRGRHLLANSVYVLRQALGKHAILVTGDALRLNPEVVGVDVVEFETALERGDLKEAAGLYRGPFLDGFFISDALELEHWTETERERLAILFAQALEECARASEAEEDLADAVRWWRRLAAHDPFSSRIALRLMHALEAAGDFGAAIHHARLHACLMREELGVEPDPEVAAQADRMKPKPTPELPRQGKERVRTGLATLAQANRPARSDEPVEDRRAPGPTGDPWGRSPRRAAVTMVLAVALLVAGGWGTRLAGGRSEGEIAGRRIDAVAHALYLKGRYAWNLRSRAGLEQATVYFRQAIERDPAYAAAYAGLADAYVILGFLGYRPAEAMFPKGKSAALRALELDSTLAEAYAPLGQALTWERKWADAEAAFRKAIALDPEYATAYQWYGIMLVPLGRVHEAVAMTRRASELDPLSVQINNTYAMFLHLAGDSDESLRHYQRIVEAEPDTQWVRRNPWVLSNMSRVLTADGRHGEALRAINLARQVVPTHPRVLWDLASTYIHMGQPERAMEVFQEADSIHEQYAFFRGAVFAAQSRADSAFHWFDRVATWGPSPMAELRMDPRLAPIRSDPRYTQLLDRLELR